MSLRYSEIFLPVRFPYLYRGSLSTFCLPDYSSVREHQGFGNWDAITIRCVGNSCRPISGIGCLVKIIIHASRIDMRNIMVGG